MTFTKKNLFNPINKKDMIDEKGDQHLRLNEKLSQFN